MIQIIQYIEENAGLFSLLIFLAIIFGGGIMFGGLQKNDQDYYDEINKL
jgi:hypothetical protein